LLFYFQYLKFLHLSSFVQPGLAAKRFGAAGVTVGTGPNQLAIGPTVVFSGKEDEKKITFSNICPLIKSFLSREMDETNGAQ
jgi:hypothetical protein